MIEVTVESPFPIASLPTVWAWIEKFRDRIADDFFPTDLDGFVDLWFREERKGRKTWAVRRAGVIGGVVTSERVYPRVADFHCVFSADFWGETTVVPALGQVCDIIFQDETIDKLSTTAFERNMSLAGMMRRFGVTREGLLLGHTRQGGKLVNLQMLGLQRERFYVVWNQQAFKLHQHDRQPNDGESVVPAIDSDVLAGKHDGNDGAERHDDGNKLGGHVEGVVPGAGADLADAGATPENDGGRSIELCSA